MTLYDPAGMNEAKIEFKKLNNIEYAQSAVECIKGKTVCFVATPWDEFKGIKSEDFIHHMKVPTIIDAWNIYDFNENDKIDHRIIGNNL